MSESVGKGNVAVDIRVPEVGVPAGAPPFAFDNASRLKQAADRGQPDCERPDWPGAAAAIDFDNGKAETVRLYPLDVGNRYEPSRRGVPHFGDEGNAR